MRVFITGLTGTLGTALAKLHKERGDVVHGCARNESRAAEWLWANPSLGQLYIGDAIHIGDDGSVMSRVLCGCDRVYHTAAMKHVELCERQPLEALRQNVHLTDVVAEACEQAGLSLVLASTDKAFRPEGVYGATKLVAERIVLDRRGSALRMVNLIGSSGSVLQRWLRDAQEGRPIQLTDPDMTRYFMTVEQAAEGMAAIAGISGLSTVSRVKAVCMGRLAQAIADTRGVDLAVIGSRPGEVRHQWLDENRCSEHAPRWDLNELLEHARATR